MPSYEHMGNGKESGYSIRSQKPPGKWLPIASAIWMIISIYPVLVFFFGDSGTSSVRYAVYGS